MFKIGRIKLLYSYKNMLFFLLLASISALFLAYVSEYGFDMKPCILCLYQRKPFFIVILLTAAVLFLPYFKRHKILAIELAMVVLLINAGIASYHVGVEKKIFSGPITCSGISSNPDTIEELKVVLKLTKPVPCNKPQFVMFGISMAGWNVIYCLGLVVCCLLFLNKNRATL